MDMLLVKIILYQHQFLLLEVKADINRSNRTFIWTFKKYHLQLISNKFNINIIGPNYEKTGEKKIIL